VLENNITKDTICKLIIFYIGGVGGVSILNSNRDFLCHVTAYILL